MNIHEYQAKETLKSYGVNIQEGIVAENAAEAVEAAKKLTAETGTSWWVIKAQIHVINSLFGDKKEFFKAAFWQIPSIENYQTKQQQMEKISNSYGFQLTNATSLAKAANLVYADWDSVDTEVKVAGYKKFKYFDKAGTQAFVAANDKNIIVSFRGTEADKMEDIITDLKVSFFECKYGKIHSGFYEAVKLIVDDVSDTVSSLRTNNQNLWVTGHSLGAALATLGTLFLQDAKLHVGFPYKAGTLVNCCGLNFPVVFTLYRCPPSGDQVVYTNQLPSGDQVGCASIIFSLVTRSGVPFGKSMITHKFL